MVISYDMNKNYVKKRKQNDFFFITTNNIADKDKVF